jgi:hypothetical protein
MTISFVKSAIVGTINELSLTTALTHTTGADTNSVSKDVDTLFFLVIPLIYVFASFDRSADGIASSDALSAQPMISPVSSCLWMDTLIQRNSINAVCSVRISRLTTNNSLSLAVDKKIRMLKTITKSRSSFARA